MCAVCYASFRLWGEDLNPNEFTAATGITPTDSHFKGDQRDRGAPYRQGQWHLSTRDLLLTTALESHLIQLLDALEPHAAPIRDALNGDGEGCDFFCYWVSAKGHGGPHLSAEVMNRMAQLQATFGLDIYFCPD